MNYLEEKQNYVDRYDLATIEWCLLTLKSVRKISKGKTKVGRHEMSYEVEGINEFFLYFKKGERYKNRQATIDEWIEKDRRLDERVKTAIFPTYIKCSKCNGELKEESRDLEDSLNARSRVQFISFCKSCGKGKVVYDNGDVYIPKPSLCPKCNSKLKTHYSFAKDTSTYSEQCTKCDYKHGWTNDFKKNEIEREKRKLKEQNLLKKYRSEFCLSVKEGGDYIHQMENMERLSKMMKELEAKNNDPEYQKARSVQKLTATELHDLLETKFKEGSFSNLSFGTPEIDRYVIITFTVEDTKKSRTKSQSIKALNRILTFALDNINWRLMSQGIEYRMGYLKGKLKGYENEEELAKFIKKKEGKKPLFWNDKGPVY